MSLRINQNVMAWRALNALQQTDNRLSGSVERLSTGLRINRAADDATGLSISERLRRQINGLYRASLNGQDALSLIQTAEGALGETQSILQRMRELAVQASSDILASTDRLEIQKEVDTLRNDINRISRGTEFNTRRLLDGSQGASISFSSSSAEGIVTGSLRSGVFDVTDSIALLQPGVSEIQRSQIMYLKDVASTLANGSTQLQSMAAFTDADGNSLLTSPQTLTLVGNGRTADITVNAQTTFNQLAMSLQSALSSSSGLSITGSKAGVVTTASSGVAGMGGYLQVTSGFAGKDARISMVGESSVIDALGFSIAREALDGSYVVSVRDRSGSTSRVQVEGNRASGLLDGLDVLFSSQAAQVAGSGGLEAGLFLSADESFTLGAGTAGGVPVVLTQGYWTLEGVARSIQEQMDVAVNGTLTLSGVTTSVLDGQIRITFEPPAAVASSGNEISLTSYVGAALNFPDGDSSGFVESSTEASKVVWGFSKYYTSIASGTKVTIQVGDGNVAAAAISVFSTAGTFGVSSRTVADMVRFSTWQATVNDSLEANSVQVRLYQVADTLAFTALRVGRQNRSGATAIDSKVELSGLTSSFTSRFGLDSSTSITSRGTGDTNFQMHAVIRPPQYQIGANQGESMPVTFADMGSKALGVDSLNLTTTRGASEALTRIDIALERVSGERAKLGAWQNRLESAINGIRSAQENLVEAESRIRDADIAAEMIDFARNQIVAQSGTAMIAQANSHAVSVYRLLAGGMTSL